MVVLKPAFLSREILRLQRGRKDGPEVPGVFRWCGPCLFRRGNVKGVQGTHEDIERLGRKEERCRIRHGDIFEGFEEKLDDFYRSTVGIAIRIQQDLLLPLLSR